MNHSEWLDKAKRLYGENAGDWKFKCPVCQTVQTSQDFVKAGLSKEEASTSIAQECIGRHLPNKEKAFGEKKRKKGVPCDYAGYYEEIIKGVGPHGSLGEAYFMPWCPEIILTTLRKN